MVEEKSASREYIKDWLPGSGCEDYVVSANVTARKPAAAGAAAQAEGRPMSAREKWRMQVGLPSKGEAEQPKAAERPMTAREKWRAQVGVEQPKEEPKPAEVNPEAKALMKC